MIKVTWHYERDAWEKMRKKVLITGHRRSGTTFLGGLIDAQPGVRLLSDYLKISRLMKISETTDPLETLPLDSRRRIVGDYYARTGLLGGRVPVVEVEPHEFEHFAQFYTLVLERAAGSEDRIVGHKVTECEPETRSILRAVPELKCVYLVRDPRDVVRSTRKRFHAGVKSEIEKWRSGVNLMLETSKDVELGSRLLIVHFEDLILNSEEALARLAGFLGIDEIRHDTPIVRYGVPFGVEENGMGFNSSFGDIQEQFDPTAAYRWRSDPGWANLAASLLCREELEIVGYERGPRSGVRDWLSLGAVMLSEHLYWPLRRVLGRTRRRFFGVSR